MVKARGYTGAPDHFRHRIAQLRPRRPREAYLRLRTLPGEQAQVDWAHNGQAHHRSGRAPPDGVRPGAELLAVTISRLRLLAPRRASLRLLRSALPPLRPLRSPGAGRFPEDLDHFYRGARAASSRWRERDIPGSWTTLAYMPRSSTPADPRTQATTGPAM